MTWTTRNGEDVWVAAETAAIPTGCPAPLTVRDLITRCGGQTKAATICGVHRQTVHHWYHGTRTPAWTAFMAMCEATETDPHRVSR